MDSVNYHSTPEAENYVYVNAQDLQPKPQKCEDVSDYNDVTGNKKTGKIFILAFGLLLMVGALSTICAVGVLYHNIVVSYKILSERYTNVTTTIMMQEDKANKTEQLYEALKIKYQQVQNNLSACNANHASRQCEEGWKTFDLKCYYFSTEKLNWIQSRDYCVEKGGHLVIITNQTEQNFVFSQISQTHWIGLNDLETEGTWMWVNNQPLKQTSTIFWFRGGPNEPDNWKKQDPSGENCAAAGNGNCQTHKWFDDSCHTLKQFICEK